MATALLLMDFQATTLGAVGGHECPALERASVAANAARAAGIDVIFVRVAWRPGLPEVRLDNPAFAALAEYGEAFDENGPGTQVHAKLGRRPGEPVVVKRRISAFASDLAEVLRGRGIDHLVLGGIVTSGVVVSTVRYACDQDYKLTVLSDACADPDPVLHDALMNRLFPQQATVISVDDWAAKL
ncbi:cysteine hydrolase [Streptomyces sp. NPDC050625]|uniref:cysteine hydrolase family protein n=1 Tax=Streptomyces sp. NPDC050625 TaxID=3154629 RepID=UPI003425A1C0